MWCVRKKVFSALLASLIGLTTQAWAHDKKLHRSHPTGLTAKSTTSVVLVEGSKPEAKTSSLEPYLVIERPLADGTVDTGRRRDFTVILSLNADSQGSFHELDHIHYGLGPFGTGIAQDCEITAVDLTGVIDVDLDAAIGHIPDIVFNGPYEFCAYMAQEDHTRVSPIACTNFTLYSAGVSVVSPQSGDAFSSFQVNVLYERYGIDANHVVWSLNGGAEQEDRSGGVIALPALDNGEHSISVRAMDKEGQQVGATVNRSFKIESKLSLENVKSAKKFVAAMERATSVPKRRREITKLSTLLASMSEGGENHPIYLGLNQDNLDKLEKLTGKLRRLAGNDTRFTKLLKQARTLLKRMSA